MVNKNEDIERYIANEMASDEMKDFENKMSNDEKLAQEVAFKKDVNDYFKSDKIGLAEELEVLGNTYFKAEKKGTSFNKLWLLLPALLLLVGLVWRMSPTNEKPAPSSNRVTNNIDSLKNSPTTPPNKIEQKPTSAPKKEITPSKPPVPTEEKQPTINQPIASVDETAFQSNPLLEGLLKEQLRDATFLTTLLSPKEGLVYPANKTIPLIIKGSTTAETPYRVIIYTNKLFDFENDHRLFEKEFQGVKKEDNYTFSLKANLPLPKGLYYLIIQQKKSNEMLYISKFSVR